MEQVNKYKKIGGGSMRLWDGRRIKPMEIFKAKESDIPNLSKVERVGVSTSMKRKEPAPPPPPTYYKKKRETSHYWDVFSEDHKQVNERALTENKADELLNSLN